MTRWGACASAFLQGQPTWPGLESPPWVVKAFFFLTISEPLCLSNLSAF